MVVKGFRASQGVSGGLRSFDPVQPVQTQKLHPAGLRARMRKYLAIQRGTLQSPDASVSNVQFQSDYKAKLLRILYPAHQYYTASKADSSQGIARHVNCRRAT